MCQSSLGRQEPLTGIGMRGALDFRAVTLLVYGPETLTVAGKKASPVQSMRRLSYFRSFVPSKGERLSSCRLKRLTLEQSKSARSAMNLPDHFAHYRSPSLSSLGGQNSHPVRITGA